MRCLAAFVFAVGLLAQGRFSVGYQSQVNGVSLRIIGGKSTPYTRAHGSDEWLVEWSSKAKTDFAHVEILYRDPSGVLVPLGQDVDANSKAKRPDHNPAFTVPLSSVVAIRVIQTRGGKVVALAEFSR